MLSNTKKTRKKSWTYRRTHLVSGPANSATSSRNLRIIFSATFAVTIFRISTNTNVKFVCDDFIPCKIFYKPKKSQNINHDNFLPPHSGSLKSHGLIHRRSTESIVHCEHCPKKFADIRLLRKHERGVHPDLPRQELTNEKDGRRSKTKSIATLCVCNKCDITFAGEQLLRVHIQEEHDGVYDSVKCLICEKRFVSSATLNLHLEKDHLATIAAERPVKIKEFKCETCSKMYRHQGALNKHKQICSIIIIPAHDGHDGDSGHKTFQCDTCKETYDNKKSLTRHIQSAHLKYRFICDQCAMPFVSAAGLRRHQTRCNQDGGTTPKDGTSKPRRQWKRNTKRVIIKCVLCSDSDEKYEYYTALRNHYASEVHADDPRMATVCIWCNMKFNFEHELGRHQRVPLLRCDLCKASQKCPTLLDRHKQKHVHSGIKHQCEECLMVFISTFSLNRHKRTIHLGQLPYHCDQCSRGFHNRANLIIHSKIHS